MMAPSIPQGRGYAQLHGAVLELLWREYPEHCITLGDRQASVVADLAIRRAAVHGFHSAADVGDYANLMVFLGSYFDEDPQLPWAAEILRTTTGVDPSARMDRLRAKVLEAFTRVVGLDGEHYRRALIWARSRPFEIIESEYADGSDDGIRRWLKDLHVQKYVSLADPVVEGLIGQSRSAAQQYGMGVPAGVVVCAGLFLLLGSSIDRDPVHPWVRATLTDSAPADPRVKAQTLRDRGIAELERFMRLDKLTRKK